MRSKVTVVLLFLNVVLFAYIYYYDLPHIREEKTVEARRRVLGPEAAVIDSLARTSRTGNPVKLVKRGESWWLTTPYEWPADRNVVDSIVNALQFLEHETSFAVADLAKSGRKLADYGLDQPALTLTFTAAGKSYDLKVGDATEINNHLYVLSPDGARIHVVSRSLLESIGRPLEDLRAPSVFTIPVFEVRSLNVQIAAPSNLKVRLRRDGANHWGFESPIAARASKSAVEVTINALNALHAKNFYDAADPRLEKSGLDAPAFRVTLEGNARRETLLLGNPLPAGPAEPGTAGASPRAAALADVEYFAKIDEKPTVFSVAVPPDLVKVLRATQEALRDPRVLDFEPGSVTGLTLTSPGQPELALQKLEPAAPAGAAASAAAKTGEGWQAVTRIAGQAPLTIAADTKVIEELLQKIYLLSVQVVDGTPKFLSDAPSAADLENWGFNRPEREITLQLNTGGGVRGKEPSTLTLQVGVSPDKPGVAFARVINTPFVYQILPDILDEAPARALFYRQRVLRDLPEGARITGLTLTDLANNTPILAKQIAETDKTWDAALASEPESRRRALAVLLPQLHTLHAKRFVADTFNPDHADTPAGPRPWKYRLELTLSFPGGAAGAQTSTSTLFLTDRLGGTTLLAGTAEFGGVVFETTQEMIDALFAPIYAEKNDPGPPAPAVAPPAATPSPAPANPATSAPKEPAATPATDKTEPPKK